MARRIILIGASGLVGGLFAECAGGAVHRLVRRSTGAGPRETVAPPGDWAALALTFAADVAVSALGTTMREAGSQAGFRAVDFDLVVGFAAAARAGGARHMIVISSVGADRDSGNFYLGIKGEMEDALSALGFGRLDILRPGLLRGRRGKDRRLGKRIGIALSPGVNLFLRGRLDRFAAIDATTVARAMQSLLSAEGAGVFVHHNRDIHRLARSRG